MDFELFTPAVLTFLYITEVLIVIAAIIIALSSVDDLLVDLYFWALKLFGNKRLDGHLRGIGIAEIANAPQRRFAIMVPAWHEHEVIESMLGANARLLDYQNHHYFVGVYQNDPLTTAAANQARQLFPNITIVTVPRDGPTSKADCLNEIVSAIFQYENHFQVRFAGIVLHDAEDLIHPQELKLFNLLIGQYDFVQLPVYSFMQPLRNFIGGTYTDEFAEVHTKDLIVREHVSGMIPCAGVAACFSRHAIGLLTAYNNGDAFRTSSITEDYDVAFRMHELGLKSTFVLYYVDYTIDISPDTLAPVYVPKRRPVATREFFPSELRAAYRQRARWLLGIVFQGMATHGWRGSFGNKYFLMRDRKVIITSPTVMLAYFTLASLLAIDLYFQLLLHARMPTFELLNEPFVAQLFLANFFFLLWRLGHRMYFTTKLYDMRQGLMAAPRLIVSNFVNFFAAVRAIRVYIHHRITGKPLVWDKTSHSYPFEAQTATGEISSWDSYQAGAWQKSSRKPRDIHDAAA